MHLMHRLPNGTYRELLPEEYATHINDISTEMDIPPKCVHQMLLRLGRVWYSNGAIINLHHPAEKYIFNLSIRRKSCDPNE